MRDEAQVRKDVGALQQAKLAKEKEVEFWQASCSKSKSRILLANYNLPTKRFLLESLAQSITNSSNVAAITSLTAEHTVHTVRVYFGKQDSESFVVHSQISCSHLSHHILHCFFASSSYYSSHQNEDQFMLVVNTAPKPGSWNEQEFSGSGLAVQFLTKLGFDAERGFGRNGQEDNSLPPLYLVRRNHQKEFQSKQQLSDGDLDLMPTILAVDNDNNVPTTCASAFEAFAVLVLKCNSDEDNNLLTENAADILDLAWLGVDEVNFLSCAQLMEALKLTHQVQRCQDAWQTVFEGIVAGASDRQVNVVNYQEFKARYFPYSTDGNMQRGLRDYFGAEIDRLVQQRKQRFDAIAQDQKRESIAPPNKQRIGRIILLLVGFILLLHFALYAYFGTWDDVLPQNYNSNVLGNVTNLVMRQNRVHAVVSTQQQCYNNNATFPGYSNALRATESTSACLTYSSSIEFASPSIAGTFSTYPNNGYECIDEVDQATRAVIVEFDYTSQTMGKTAHVVLLEETDSSGAISAQRKLQSETFVFPSSGLVIASMVCLFAALVLAFRDYVRTLLVLLAALFAFAFIFQSDAGVLSAALVFCAVALALLSPPPQFTTSVLVICISSGLVYFILVLGWTLGAGYLFDDFSVAFANLVLAGVFPQYSPILFAAGEEEFIPIVLSCAFLLMATSTIFTMLSLAVHHHHK